MSHSPEQKSLTIAIAQRAEAEANLTRYRQSVAALRAADETASKGEAEARSQLEAATMAKVKGEPDTTANARAVYHTALQDRACSEAELAAGQKLVVQAEEELERLTKQAARCAVYTCQAIAAHAEPRLLAAALAYGQELARRRAIIDFASAASAASGTVAAPVAELNPNNPLHLKLEALINGTDPDTAMSYSEQDLLDAKLDSALGRA